MCEKIPSFKLLQTLHSSSIGLNSLLAPDRNPHCDIVHKCEVSKMATNQPATDLSGDEDVCEHNDCRRTVFVRSVPHSIRRKELNQFFSQFGALSKVSIHTNCKTRKSKGTAHVQFVKLEDAMAVLKFPDGQLICRGNVLKPIPNRCQRVWKYASAKRMSTEVSASSEIETECHMNMLPLELLTHIFSFLEFKERIRIEKVCKLWRHLGSTIPWANVYSLALEDRHFPHRQKLNSSVLEAILRRCGSTIKKIDLSMSIGHSLSHKFPIVIGNHCPNLEEINLSRKEISCKALGVLAESCPKLKIIDISKSSAGDKWISKLFRHCKIERLNLSHDNKISGKNFHLMKDHIRVLNVNYCTNLVPEVLDPISELAFIRELHLNNCSTLSSKSVEKLFDSCGHSLRILDLGGYFPNLNRWILLEGFKKCANLEELFIENNNFIDDDICQVVSKNCARLHTLNISSCYISDKGLKWLSTLDGLRKLYANYNERITDEGLEELSAKGSLEMLELRGCSSVGDGGCSALVVNCRNLVLLDVSSCSQVTDAAFVESESVNRPADVALCVYAGGSSVTEFWATQTVEISQLNKCPREHRPWHMDFYYEDGVDLDDDIDDDNWDEEFNGYYDYDSDYLYDENDDVEAWELAYMS